MPNIGPASCARSIHASACPPESSSFVVGAALVVAIGVMPSSSSRVLWAFVGQPESSHVVGVAST